MPLFFKSDSIQPTKLNNTYQINLNYKYPNAFIFDFEIPFKTWALLPTLITVGAYVTL